MPQFLHQRPLHNPLSVRDQLSPRSSANSHRHIPIFFNRTGLLALLSLLLILGFFFPWARTSSVFSPSESSSSSSLSKWRRYTLPEAASFVAKNGTIIVCAVSHPWLPFLNNWLISVSRQKHQDKVLVIAEDYATLFKVNGRWPGHAVLVPPAPDSQTAHDFGSQGFFNFTSRRPRHLLQILELGYNVMYNDVDMVWLGDPFAYLEGSHDVYFMDDMAEIKPLDHSHDLPPPGKKGRPYVCSCMIFLRPTNGAKLVMKKWIEELQAQPWSKAMKASDQPAFNWALNKTAGQVDLYLLPQAAFPTGGLYFTNKTWVEETKGKHIIIHNNYIRGFDNKMKRFRDYGLWLVDNHANESPLGKL
ncbi:UDP-D-xylose:L-fucose alpha-1,3-D-xylosyltransferase mgp4 [Turnera subulata]|uniref:Glycosyltransferase n=1 Tax=Turnera subulata TaxID=218843 RepID=A0A9Q0JCV7_9ROSI|nr:UDP-D-xylose:L-fucose alpha-1,3-D-xylosyltransferase mgp4 [Turnera subulata]